MMIRRPKQMITVRKAEEMEVDKEALIICVGRAIVCIFTAANQSLMEDVVV